MSGYIFPTWRRGINGKRGICGMEGDPGSLPLLILFPRQFYKREGEKSGLILESNADKLLARGKSKEKPPESEDPRGISCPS